MFMLVIPWPQIKSLLCRLKINHVMENRNIRLFSAPWTVWLRTICIVIRMKFIVRLLFKIINYLWIFKFSGLSVPQKKLFSNNFPLWQFDPEIFHLAEVLVEEAVEEGIGAGAAHAADVTGCVHQHTCLLLQPIRVLKKFTPANRKSIAS
jgi:hypothetical protein